MEFDSNMRLSEQPKIAMGATRNHDPMGTTPRIELIDATRRDSTGAHWMMPDTAKYTTESVRLDGCDPVSVTRSVGFERRDCSQNATESVQLDGCDSKFTSALIKLNQRCEFVDQWQSKVGFEKCNPIGFG